MKSKSRVLFWIVGVALLGVLVHQVGLTEVWHHVKDAGWQIVPIVMIALSWHVSNSWAWWACFEANASRPRFWRLLRTKLCGEAVGNVTPASYVGSELAKVYMLRSHIAVTRGLPSLVINKTVEVISGLGFALAGTAVAFYVFPLPREIRIGLTAALMTTTVVVVVLVLRQRRNTFGWILDLSRRAGFTFLERRRAKIEETDRNIAAFYARNRSGFLLSLGFHLLSWLLGVCEIYYILRVLGEPLSFGTALLLGSLNLIINTAFFFIPSGVGVFEGGHVFLFHLLGLDPGLGLAVGILRRIRKIFWIAVGFLLLLTGSRRATRHSPAA